MGSSVSMNATSASSSHNNDNRIQESEGYETDCKDEGQESHVVGDHPQQQKEWWTKRTAMDKALAALTTETVRRRREEDPELDEEENRRFMQKSRLERDMNALNALFEVRRSSSW